MSDEERAELERHRDAVRAIAELVPGADPEDPIGVVVHVRETLREHERFSKRMRDLEARIARASAELGGVRGR